MMKWLFLGASFLLARYTNALKAPAVNLMEHVSFLSKRLLLVSVGSLIAATMFTAGLCLAIYNFFEKYDTTGSFGFSGAVVGGIFLALTGAAVFIAIYNMRPALYTSLYGHKKEKGLFSKGNSRRSFASPIEDALAALVNDYIKDRELKRQLNRKRLHLVTEEDFTEDVNFSASVGPKARPGPSPL